MATVKVKAHHRKGHHVKAHSRKVNKHAKGILKALGEKKPTGNFKKIEAKEGKGAAIGALQNKLAARRGEKIPYHGRKG